MMYELPEFNNKPGKPITEYVAWFCALLQAKALHTYDKESGMFSYKYCKKEYDIALRTRDMLNIFTDMTDIDYEIELQMYDRYYIVYCISNDIYTYLFEKLKCDKVPPYIQHASHDKRLSYLAGMIDGNSSCNKYNLLNICSDKSDDFMQELQMLCCSCNIDTNYKNNKLYVVNNKSLHMIYNVKVLLKYQIVSDYLII